MASDAAFFNDIGGKDLACDAIRARAGTLHDPSLADAFVANATDILANVSDVEPGALLLKAEPHPVNEIDRAQMIDVVAAFGDAADLKTPYTHGHSGATAEVAGAAGERLGLDGEAVDSLRFAACLHDVGHVAISNAVWEKAGTLKGVEWEQVRMHAYRAERIVARSPSLNGLARTVGIHHERLDGSGYHRGSRASEIPTTARVVAVADAWVSMQQPRPHRRALDPDETAAELQAGSTDGRFDSLAVTAVLEAAGLSNPRRQVLPGGLSSREVEVLRLVAAGHSNPEIADLCTYPAERPSITCSTSTGRSVRRPGREPPCSPSSTTCWRRSAPDA